MDEFDLELQEDFDSKNLGLSDTLDLEQMPYSQNNKKVRNMKKTKRTKTFNEKSYVNKKRDRKKKASRLSLNRMSIPKSVDAFQNL